MSYPGIEINDKIEVLIRPANAGIWSGAEGEWKAGVYLGAGWFKMDEPIVPGESRYILQPYRVRKQEVSNG